MRPRLLIIRRAVLLVAWLSCGGALAADWGSTSPITLALNGTSVTASPGAPATGQTLQSLLQGRTYTPKPNGGVDITELLKQPYVPKDKVPVSAVRAVPWSAIAKGVGRAVPFVGTALTIKDLLDAVRCQQGAGGPECDAGQVEEDVQEWKVVAGNPSQEIFAESAEEACGAGRAIWNGLILADAPAGYSRQIVYNQIFAPGCGGNVTIYNVPAQGQGQATVFFSGATTFVASLTGPITSKRCPKVTINGAEQRPPKGKDGKCPTTVYEPATVDEVADKVEEHGDKELARPALVELDQKGIGVEHDAPSFQVPPTVIGERERINHPDGSVTIRDHDWTMEPTPEGYRWQPRIRETLYPPGATIPPQGADPTAPGSEGTGSPPDNAVPPPDPDMPPLPELYERKYPDGLQGVWDSRKAELEASPIFAFLASLVPSFGDGGCPVWALPVDVLGIAHAGTEATVPCYVWAFVRLVVILTALLLSRRLIFGG